MSRSRQPGSLSSTATSHASHPSTSGIRSALAVGEDAHADQSQPKPGIFKICSFTLFFYSIHIVPWRLCRDMRYLQGLGRLTSAMALMGFFIMQRSAKISFPPPKWCNATLLLNVNWDGPKATVWQQLHSTEVRRAPVLPDCSHRSVYTSSSAIKNRAIINEQFAVVTTSIGGSEASHSIPTLLWL